MVTVHREAGLRFVIYTDDHAPAHVHIVGDGTAKVQLDRAGAGPQLISAEGMSRGDLRKAMRVVTERQEQLLARWRGIHG